MKNKICNLFLLIAILFLIYCVCCLCYSQGYHDGIDAAFDRIDYHLIGKS